MVANALMRFVWSTLSSVSAALRKHAKHLVSHQSLYYSALLIHCSSEQDSSRF